MIDIIETKVCPPKKNIESTVTLTTIENKNSTDQEIVCIIIKSVHKCIYYTCL